MIPLILFYLFLFTCHRHREEARVGTPNGQQHGRHQERLPNWMKRAWRLLCVAMVSFLKPLICTGEKYLPTPCTFKRSWCQPRHNSLPWMWLANTGHTWRKLPVSFLLSRSWPPWNLSSASCMLELMLLSVRYVYYFLLSYVNCNIYNIKLKLMGRLTRLYYVYVLCYHSTQPLLTD